MRGERGHSRSNKWILKNQQVDLEFNKWKKVMQQVQKGNTTGGKRKMQQVEKVIQQVKRRLVQIGC